MSPAPWESASSLKPTIWRALPRRFETPLSVTTMRQIGLGSCGSTTSTTSSSRYEDPRGVSGEQLTRSLGRLGYHASRQSGSHIRLTTQEGGEHHITIPLHQELRLGTLSAILSEVSRHHSITRDELLERLFPH